MLGRNAPAVSPTDHGRAEVVDCERNDPDGDAVVSIEEAGDHEQGGAEQRGRRESQQRAAEGGIVTDDDGGQEKMKQADDEVRDTEQHRVVSEGAGHRQSGDKHRAHRGEHQQPDAALVDVHRAREPRVHAPRPPERSEGEHPAEDPVPRRVVREQDRDLSKGEDEGQVEEELERSDLVLRVWLELAARVVGHARTLAWP